MEKRTMAYEVPAVAEMGGFAELTRITDKGGYLDGPWGAWWLD